MMQRMLCSLLVVLSLACTSLLTTTSLYAGEDSKLPEVEVTKVRQVFDNGEHNAFTDMIKFKGKYYLTFRTCPGGHMLFPTSRILIMQSDDAENWKQVDEFSVPKRDVRDPHFLIFKDKLFVYTGTWYCGDSAPKTRTINEIWDMPSGQPTEQTGRNPSCWKAPTAITSGGLPLMATKRISVDAESATLRKITRAGN